jgi:hypothetical protein
MMQFVTGRTRAPMEGRVIIAPCGRRELVYHFAWFALLCQRCKESHSKTDYRVEVTQ